MQRQKGIALTAVIMASVVFAVAAFAVLMVALSMARRGGFDARRLQARYAAEAGLVWAKENLWNNPLFCNDNITVNGFAVSITGTNCGTNNITIQSRIDPY